MTGGGFEINLLCQKLIKNNTMNRTLDLKINRATYKSVDCTKQRIKYYRLYIYGYLWVQDLCYIYD